MCGAKHEAIVSGQTHVGDTSGALRTREREQEFGASQIVDVNVTVGTSHDTAYAVSRHRNRLHLTKVTMQPFSNIACDAVTCSKQFIYDPT